MLKSYLIIALRHLIRDRLHSFIMISGLVVGMTCAILTSMFIRHELSYDRFHTDADRIYRVTLERLNPDGSLMVHTGRVGFPVFELLRSEFPAAYSTRSLLSDLEPTTCPKRSLFLSKDSAN